MTRATRETGSPQGIPKAERLVRRNSLVPLWETPVHSEGSIIRKTLAKQKEKCNLLPKTGKERPRDGIKEIQKADLTLERNQHSGQTIQLDPAPGPFKKRKILTLDFSVRTHTARKQARTAKLLFKEATMKRARERNYADPESTDSDRDLPPQGAAMPRPRRAQDPVMDPCTSTMVRPQTRTPTRSIPRGHSSAEVGQRGARTFIRREDPDRGNARESRRSTFMRTGHLREVGCGSRPLVVRLTQGSTGIIHEENQTSESSLASEDSAEIIVDEQLQHFLAVHAVAPLEDAEEKYCDRRTVK